MSGGSRALCFVAHRGLTVSSVWICTASGSLNWNGTDIRDGSQKLLEEIVKKPLSAERLAAPMCSFLLTPDFRR